ncbi:arsenate reductase/protein-tyrosine-phosphatase family protein [Agreia pratensis]|uniref:protein-tyrosine-phosphatase n=1 Tax=Agreia pratensis TaxID=150121 RepID=A0A1X7IN76_9MICO|nr:low molecular weight phosphatase family protein [Agreia pratensis]SMG16103.1 protein-tyrosine phosphatase [Agreia pratensis]
MPSVLFVCTGNICRSPLAEQLFRARMDARGMRLVASSAGTGARAGELMTPQAAELSLRYGGDPSLHSASPIDAAGITASNLVLTASREHRSAVVSLVPRASRYTFTLREFARLVDISAAESLVPDGQRRGAVIDFDLDEFVRQTASLRGHGSAMPTAADDDIADPYRRKQSVYDEAGALIDHAVDAIVTAIARASLKTEAPRPRRSAGS